MKRNWLKWLLLLPLCLCCWHLLLWYLVVPEFVGGLAANLTKYSNAKLLYLGYRIYGSSEWQSRTYIYWSPDKLPDVEQNYTRYFPSFQEPEYLLDQPKALKFIRTGSRIFAIGLDVSLLDASQTGRSRMLIHSYDGDPYSVLDAAPNYGTLIIFSHDIFAP